MKFEAGSASVALCSGVGASDGTFTCRGSIPPAPGNPGTDAVKATGEASGTKPSALFLVTS